MKVFISWSGNRSRAVGEVLNDWIKCVLQAARPWMSTRDIDRGALWFNEINDQLKDTAVGIVCLTQENKNRPWILFEAGALAKGLSSSRVCTFLVDMQPTDVEDPLAQFNHTLPDAESLWGLVRTLNASLGANGLDDRVLDQVFKTYWPQFEEKFKKAIKENPLTEKPEPRSEKNILAEILDTTRSLHQRIQRIEIGEDRDDPRSDAHARRAEIKYWELPPKAVAKIVAEERERRKGKPAEDIERILRESEASAETTAAMYRRHLSAYHVDGGGQP